MERAGLGVESRRARQSACGACGTCRAAGPKGDGSWKREGRRRPNRRVASGGIAYHKAIPKRRRISWDGTNTRFMLPGPSPRPSLVDPSRRCPQTSHVPPRTRLAPARRKLLTKLCTLSCAYDGRRAQHCAVVAAPRLSLGSRLPRAAACPPRSLAHGRREGGMQGGEGSLAMDEAVSARLEHRSHRCYIAL